MCDQHEIPVYHVCQQSNSDFPMHSLVTNGPEAYSTLRSVVTL